jgi:hypothetical protein
MIKVAPYIIMLVLIVVIPILDKVATALEVEAKKTPDTWDDVLAGSFRTVVDALKGGGIFEPKK